MRNCLLFTFVGLTACATQRAATPPLNGAVTLDPIEPVAAYLQERPASEPRILEGSTAPIRVELLEVAVLPTRQDGTRWDGGRLPDDATQVELTEALAAPDAARRAPALLRSAPFTGESAPDLAGELRATDGSKVLASARLLPVADSDVRSGVALDPFPLGPSTVVTLRLVDVDPTGEELVGEVSLDHERLLDALHARAPAVFDLRGSGTGAILFVTVRVTAR
jgi:hypothetical protein